MRASGMNAKGQRRERSERDVSLVRNGREGKRVRCPLSDYISDGELRRSPDAALEASVGQNALEGSLE